MHSIKGIHHITAMTSSGKMNLHFYTQILGMRLVKKTVNQDDVTAYHLFYADDIGNPGTDLTFFEFKNSSKKVDGTQSIDRFGLRVKNDKALEYWLQRLDEFEIDHSNIQEYFGHQSISFEDPDGLKLRLISNENHEGMALGQPYPKSPVPEEYQILGLGMIEVRVPNLELTHNFLIDVLGFNKLETVDNKTLYEIGEGGQGAQIILVLDENSPRERQGYGGVHHLALRLDNRESIDYWIDQFNQNGYRHSGFVERYYFQSLYARERNGILFELATDGPGFMGDETYENMGQTLSLPPYFEPYRKNIEAGLEPLD